MISTAPHNMVCEFEGTCADCGQLTSWRRRCVDSHTASTMELCGNCLPAFMQRQQHPPGCCN